MESCSQYKDSLSGSESSKGGEGVGVSGSINGHEYVDLGLSVKWATCNVGASKPEDYGDYFAWGETTTKDSYTQTNFKANGKDLGDITGNSSYDAARANWGGTWRLPTAEEFAELFDECTWEDAVQGGHDGYEVTGPNGNSIFLPAAGLRLGSSLHHNGGPMQDGPSGHYWSSTPIDGYSNNAHDYSCSAYDLYFDNFQYGVYTYYCVIGLTVRPVTE